MSRRPTDPTRRLGLIAVAVALAAALGVAGARLGGRGRGSGIAVTDTFRCRCGAEYRVSGADRHRVHWPAGASEAEPVLDDRCTSCGTPLPAGHADRAA
ncbi:MAG: hypothetical protein ACR2L8_13180 [Solirubrobacteraceae bacterium]